MKKNIKISKKDINFALKCVKKNENALLFSLGVGLQYEYAPPGIRFFAPYGKMGQEFWSILSYEIYILLCDPNKKEPKEWVKELIAGDIRNLIAGIIAAITATYNVGLGIAIPAVALIIKKGLVSYCRKKSQKRSTKTVKTILKMKKKQMQRLKKD